MSHRIAGALGRRTIMGAAATALVASALAAAPVAEAQERKTLKKYDADTVVVTVGKKKMTLGDLMTARPRIPANVEVSDANALMDSTMNRLSSEEVLAQAAEKAGIADEKGMQLRLAAMRRSALGQAYLGKLAQEKISEDSLKKLYDEVMSNEVTKAPFVQNSFRLIQVETKKEADDLHKKAKGGADFAELAAKHSKHVSKNNGGLFPFHSPSPRPTPVDLAAVTMQKKGEISDILEMGKQFFFIKMEGKRTLTFEQTKAALRKISFDRLAAAEIVRLRKEIGVKPAATLPPGDALLKNDLIK